MTKLKNLNFDKTQKLKLWQNSKSQIVTKLKNLNFDKTRKPENSNCDTTKIVTKLKKIKLGQNAKTQIVTKLKTQIVTKLKNSTPVTHFCFAFLMLIQKHFNFYIWPYCFALFICVKYVFRFQAKKTNILVLIGVNFYMVSILNFFD